MKAKILALATTIALAVAAPAAHAMMNEVNMLTTAVTNELSSRGFDTAKVMDLTLSQISQIANLLNQGEMTAETKGQIEKILGN